MELQPSQKWVKFGFYLSNFRCTFGNWHSKAAEAKATSCEKVLTTSVDRRR